jgi:hypothetical protein
MTDSRVSAWTAGAAASVRTGFAGLGARTAGAPPSASTTDKGAGATTLLFLEEQLKGIIIIAGAPPNAE